MPMEEASSEKLSNSMNRHLLSLGRSKTGKVKVLLSATSGLHIPIWAR